MIPSRRNVGRYVVSNSLVRRRLNTISILIPNLVVSMERQNRERKHLAKGTFLRVGQNPGSDEVLSKFCGRLHVNEIRNHLHCFLVKLVQFKLHAAHLYKTHYKSSAGRQLVRGKLVPATNSLPAIPFQ